MVVGVAWHRRARRALRCHDADGHLRKRRQKWFMGLSNHAQHVQSPGSGGQWGTPWGGTGGG